MTDIRTPVRTSHDEPIGQLFHRLVDDGKAYALAEVDVVKANVSARVAGARTSVILGVAAIFVLQAGLTTLFVAIGHVLALLVGVWAGLLIAALLALALAGGMAYYAATHFSPVDQAPVKAP